MQEMEYFYYAIFKDTTNSFLTLNFYIALFNAFNHSNISNVPLHHMSYEGIKRLNIFNSLNDEYMMT